MKKVYLPIILISCISFLVSCKSNETAQSDTVKQTEIFQSYDVTYNAPDESLSASATFRFGGTNGTTLILSNPAKILFNDEEMKQSTLLFGGAYYSWEKQCPLPQVFRFEYTDCDKKVFKNAQFIFPLEIISSQGKVFSAKGENRVAWDGPAIANGEKVTLYIEDSKSGIRSFDSDKVGDQFISFDGSRIADMNLGKAQIYLQREKSTSLAQCTHLGGEFFARYKSKKTEAEIVK
ncbi:MAG: hypothetical protein V2A54_05740 [Bacteroidota bacterium]